jgi:hypothetical protein
MEFDDERIFSRWSDFLQQNLPDRFTMGFQGLNTRKPQPNAFEALQNLQ